MGPAVHAFNAALIGTCTTDNLETGIACLGIIELAFADVSAMLGQFLVDRGWVSPDRLVHYALHAELDVRHAEDLFAMAEPVFDDPRKRAAIEAGLRLGAHAFERLYRDLAEVQV
jgi:pyrroloquinoline-quinone synthase